MKFSLPLLLWLWCGVLAGAGTVPMPYAHDFTSTAGAFATSGTWALSTGAFRNTVTSGAGIASVEATALGGEAASAPDFFVSAKFNVEAGGHVDTGVGFALLGSNATFSGGLSQPYYLVEVKPGRNVLRVSRVGINVTQFIPDNTALTTFTLSPNQPITLEVLGSYENGVLRLDVTVRQGEFSDTFIAVDSEPLPGKHFGFRNLGGGGTSNISCDDFLLRRRSRLGVTVPAPFAQPGLPYVSSVQALSSTGTPEVLTAPVLPAWLSFTPTTADTGTLTGTPAAAQTGVHTVRLSATDAEEGMATQDFPVTVLEPTGVIISEFLAENETGLRDEDKTQGDWIELFNASPSEVDIGGWFLSDDLALPRKWTIPTGVTLPPYGFLVIYASDKNRTADPARLHTNFKLSNNAGSSLTLANAAGTVVSAYANYPAQRADRSYGRYGSYTPAGYLVTPTPGVPNNLVGYNGFVARPAFSIQRGFFSAPQTVSFSTATPGATLVHTLEGSTPTLTNGVQTAAPNATATPQRTLTIAATTTLRVAGFAPGLAPAPAETQTYLFLGDVVTQSSTPPAGWPRGKVNGQVLKYGMNSSGTAAGTPAELSAALAALPTLSLVTDLPNLFDKDGGIYVNPYGREEGFECPVSVELLQPDATPGFSVSAGLRIRGGASREGTNPKHNFHLYFRSEYGASKLKFPLFGNEGTNEFDRIDLRATQVKSWHRGDSSATYNRDEWSRYTHAAMGQPYTRSRYYHLYINGLYWGLYGTQERADSDFAASYFGGEKEDYDVLKTYVIPHRVEAADGDSAAWTALHNLAKLGFGSPANYNAAQGLDSNGQPSATLKPLVDLDNLIDYTLLNYYIGNGDGPVNTSVNVPKNFYAIRPRDGRFGFRFFAHDCEDGLVHPNPADVSGTTSTGSTLLYFNPRWLSQQLEASPKYRLRFADRAQKHLFHGGALAPEVGVARWRDFRSQINVAIRGESARWGGGRTVTNFNTAHNTIETNFFPTRGAAIVAQLRKRSLFPSIDAPVFSQPAGNVPSGAPLTISGPPGATLFFTVNGGDPMEAGATTYSTLIPLTGTQVTVRARAFQGAIWSALTEVTYTIDALPAAAGRLAISEIHYHPDGPNELTEFVELLNLTSGNLDLAGVSLSGGIGFTFGNVILSPGQCICVISDLAAFRAAYGAAPLVAGVKSGGLKNSSDTVILSDRNGTEIERVVYKDVLPWPTVADGDGPSLVRGNLSGPAGDAASWRPSVGKGGNPGGSDGQTVAEWLESKGISSPMDLDDRGNPALLAFVCGLDLSGSAVPTLSITPEQTANPTSARVTFRRRLAADGVNLTLQIGSEVGTGASVVSGSSAAPIISCTSHGDGTESITVRITATPPTFVRLRATLP